MTNRAKFLRKGFLSGRVDGVVAKIKQMIEQIIKFVQKECVQKFIETLTEPSFIGSW